MPDAFKDLAGITHTQSSSLQLNSVVRIPSQELFDESTCTRVLSYCCPCMPHACCSKFRATSSFMPANFVTIQENNLEKRPQLRQNGCMQSKLKTLEVLGFKPEKSMPC
eukprot:scaffold161756_cov15-Tisochrysis_lutea.AAC.1